MTPSCDVVVVGTSWGGLDALRTLLVGLPPELDAALVIVQHRSADSHPTALRDLLGAATRLTVLEAEDKQDLLPGCAYVAPPDYHTLVEAGELALSVDERVSFARPSVDVLFETAAEAYRERTVGVVLTGANADGAAGLKRIVDLGGFAVVQDPETAERAEMPRAALAAVPDARVAPVDELPGLLVALCGLTRVGV